MRVRLIVMLGLITVFVAAGAGIFGLGGGASGPAVDVSHAQAPDEKVHREVVEALETQPWADVIVALREPPAARRAPLDLPALQQQVAAEQENMLSGLSGADFQVLRRYDSIPAVFGRVSVAGLDKLADHPNVTSVHPNIELHATLSESVPMINADDVHTMGYTGAGVTVAVLDTGIDTDHADLQDDLLAEHCYLTSPDTCPCGGTTAHGSGCAEDGAGHGSHVSGIITSGGVVAPGGVAPDAGIIAFKVLNDSGSGLLSDSLDALNYIIANPGDGVDAINMSLGSGPWTTPCDGAWPELTTAFNTLRSAGVTAFVSSGNDNDKILLGFPSCISSAVSVGAVYDANVGSIAWSACTDSSTWADLVVCFSNSHSTELDLLAPGALITSSVNGGGTDEYGGTSMAAPHAAGVAALMLDANPSATADQIESCMETTGVPVTDPDNSVTTPRVDALAAVQCIAPSGDDTDGDGCADVEEQAGAPAPKPGSTGAYDPLAWHDFYDVPVPAMPDAVCANGPKNLAIAMDDVLAVLFYAGTYAGDGGVPNADGVAYDSDKGVDTDADTVADIPADGVPDGQDYDRSPSPDPNPPWNAGPPSGAVAMDDVLAVLAQTGLSCIEPP